LSRGRKKLPGRKMRLLKRRKKLLEIKGTGYRANHKEGNYNNK